MKNYENGLKSYWEFSVETRSLDCPIYVPLIKTLKYVLQMIRFNLRHLWTKKSTRCGGSA